MYRTPFDLSPNGSFSDKNWERVADFEGPVAAERNMSQLSLGLSRMKLDPGRIKTLQNLVAMLKKRGSKVHLYLGPIHEEIWRRLDAMDGLADIQKITARLKDAVPEIIDLSRGEYSAAPGFFNADPVHFRSAVGVRLLQNEVLKRPPQ